MRVMLYLGAQAPFMYYQAHPFSYWTAFTNA